MSSQVLVWDKLGFQVVDVTSLSNKPVCDESLSKLPNINGIPPITRLDELLDILWSPSGVYVAFNSRITGLGLLKVGQLKPNEVAYQKIKIVLPDHLHDLPPKQLTYLGFSPKSTHLQGWWTPNSTPHFKNFVTWKITPTELRPIVTVLHLKVSRASWPPVRWRDDERYVVLEQESELQIYSGDSIANINNCLPLVALEVAGPRTFFLAPVHEKHKHVVVIAVLLGSSAKSAENSSQSKLTFWIVRMNGDGSVRTPVFCSRTCPAVKNADSIHFEWSPSRDSGLCIVDTLVDTYGHSYEGRSDAFLVDLKDLISGVGEYNLKPVNTKAVQAVKWSPAKDEFILIEGSAPGTIALYNGAAKKLHTFPKLFHNTISWNNFGSIVALGGFGSLAGDITFWRRNKDKDGTSSECFSLIASWREPCTVSCEWSPCGYYFFTATLRPRMKVDNKITIWYNNGQKLFTTMFEELYAVLWRPGDKRYIKPCSVPEPLADIPTETVTKETYMPKGSSTDPNSDSALMVKYLAGEISETELPEAIQKRVKAKRGSVRQAQQPGAAGTSSGLFSARQNPSERNPKKNDKAKKVDWLMDWRSTGVKSRRDSSVASGPKAQADTQSESPVEVPVLEDSELVEPAEKMSLTEGSDSNVHQKVDESSEHISTQQNTETLPGLESNDIFTSGLETRANVTLSSTNSQVEVPPQESANTGLSSLLGQLQSILPKSATLKVVPADSSSRMATPVAKQPSVDEGHDMPYKLWDWLSDVPLQPSGNAYCQEDPFGFIGESSKIKYPAERPTIQSWESRSSQMHRPDSDHRGQQRLESSSLRSAQRTTPQLWEYIDPKGNIQGPFSRQEMRIWWTNGFFPRTLLIRSSPSESFAPLEIVFPSPAVPFLSYEAAHNWPNEP